MKVIVLGAGLVGGPMAVDLAKDHKFKVTVVDRDQAALEDLKTKHPQLNTLCSDLSDSNNVTGLVEEHDLAVNAVPGFMGFETAKSILKAGKNAVDISFYEEDPFLLDSLAKKMNVTMIMDCGVCPGMNNILIMHAALQLDPVESPG